MPTRVAVIGAGAWGINHVRVLATEPRCVLACVADPDPATHEQTRAVHPNIHCTRDPDDVLSDPSIDAVVIATPARTHADLACAALQRGKHVLVEKPLAMDIAAARRVAEACRTANRVGMVGHLMVCHPAIVRVRELLRDGALGALHYIHSIRANIGRLREDESALWSFGPHDLSMLDFLVDEPPVSVSARGQCVVHTGVEDVVFLTLKYGSGLMAQVQLSRISAHKERRLTMVCSRRVAEFDDVSPEKLRLYNKAYDDPPTFTQFSQYLTIRDGEVVVPQIQMDEPLHVELRQFLDCIVHGETPIASIDSGVTIVSILAAAEESIRMDGAPVPLANLF